MRIQSLIKNWAPLALVLALALPLAACDDKSSPPPPPQQTSQAPKATAPAPAPAATVKTAAAPVAPAPQGEVSTSDNVYIVFDGSGSMGNCVDRNGDEKRASNTCPAKIIGGKAALLSVVNKIPDTGVNLGLYVFDYNGRKERVALGPNNRDAVLKAGNAITAGDGTPLGPAIKVAAQALVAQYNKQLGYGTYRLVVVTDGMPDSEYDVKDALAFIKKSGVPIAIYTVGFGMNDPKHPLRAASVTFTPAYNGAEVKDALEKAVSESDSFDPTDFNGKK